MPELDDLKPQLNRMVAELQKRQRRHAKVNPYYEGDSPVPIAVSTSRLTKAYEYLMPMADAPWGSLVVNSVQDRLEISGIQDENKAAADAVWEVWQRNGMDAEAKLAHNAALVDGRCTAMVWPGEDGEPEIALDDVTQMVVEYREGDRRRRSAAARLWTDVETDKPFATLYRPDGIFKFEGDKDTPPESVDWEMREVETEVWPMRNPYNVVPVVELAVNRRLKPGTFTFARGEYEHCLGLIDRINLLTFLGMVVAVWMGFPLRGVIGDRILRDDDGAPIPPFDAEADSVFQLENPEATIAEYKAADRKNLAVFPELDQLAVITSTPRHYFPLEQGMSNLSADAIRASEGGLHAKTTGHKASLGEGWEETLRLAGKMLRSPVEISQLAEMQWLDHESRSLAERADAATKLKDILPWQALAKRVLNASDSEIARWEAQKETSAIGQLIAATREQIAAPVAPAEAPTAEMPMMGNGNTGG